MRRLLLSVLICFVAAPVLAADCSAFKDTPRPPIRPQDFTKMKEALDGGLNPNAFEGEYSLLMFAARNGEVDLTKLLLARGAKTEHRDRNKDRALLWSAENGQVETTRMLLDAGSPVETDDDPHGLTPLMKAARNGHAATVCLLLERGAKADKLSQYGSTTPLHEAVLSRKPAVVSMLLEKGANPRVVISSLRDTPLHVAVTYGGPDIVRLLIPVSALEARDNTDRTPLWRAAMYDRAEMVELLLAAGADPDARTKSGQTAFVTAALKSGAAARLLIERTQDLDQGFAAAVWGGHADMAKRLRERGASVDAVMTAGEPALAGTTRHQGLAMLDWMVEQKVDVKRHGPATLFEAARSGRVDIARRLLDLGVQVDGREVEAAMTYVIGSIEAQIKTNRASAALRPTADLEARIKVLSAAHAQIRDMIGK